MKRLLTLLLLLGCTLGAYGADTLPQLDIDAVDHPVVMLPDNHAMAVRILHQWNANAAVMPAAPAGKAGLPVPTLRDLFGADGKDGGPAKTAPSVQGWNLGLDGYGLVDAAEADHLVFPLYHHKDPGALILVVPGTVHEQRLQAFVDSTVLAAGGEVPRLRPHSTERLSFVKAVKTIAQSSGLAQLSWGNYAMLAVGILLLYLGIAKGFEPLLLVPIAIGCVFVNSAGAGMVEPADADSAGGILWFFSEFGIATGIFPLLIFLGVGALTDFGPLLANPWSALLGGAAQFGIFGSFFMAVLFGFDMADAGAIAIIGGADGPTSIYVASKLAPEKLGAIAVAAYSYMALVPIIQPPVMKALTTDAERQIMMTQRKPVSKTAKIIFPMAVFLMCSFLLPSSVPLIGMLMFGNLLRECGVADRLAKAAQNELINLVTIGLGLSVGTKLSADKFLNLETLGILVLGCVAFVIGTATGVLFGKAMCKITGGKVNPLIGAAGVSAVPMAARVVQNVGASYNKRNFLLMHAMGPNVAGVIGSAVAAGILLALLGK
jgi:sodium ion-translocating decarboxylase beta subunit